MKRENAERVVGGLREAMVSEEEAYRLLPEYSGRGMWGETTCGVVTPSLLDVGVAVGALGLDADLLGVMRVDQLGRQWVVY